MFHTILTIAGSFYPIINFKTFRPQKMGMLQQNNNNVESGKAKQKKKSVKFLDKLMSCFSVWENSKIITSSSIGNDSIEVIHGMRYNFFLYL